MPFHSPKYVEKRRKRLVTIMFLCALCAVTIAASVVLLARSSLFQIDIISVKGLDPLSNEKVQEKIAPLISNTFFIPKSEIENIIKENFKEVETVEIRRSGLSEVVVSLHTRTQAATVCLGFRNEESLDTCYASDSHGYVFSTAPVSTSTSAFNHYYVPETGTSTVGFHFISEERFLQLEKFLNQARLGGLAPLGILIGDNGDYEMYLKNKRGDSEVTVYFDDNAPFDTTLSNLLTFWQATTTRTFDYINLRFGNTVYYSTQ